MSQASTILQTKPAAVWIGSVTHANHQRPWSYVCEHCSVQLRGDLPALLRGIDEPNTTPPEVVFLAENYPQQLSRLELDTLRRRWPLAGWVHLVSDWSEGEPRTGTPIVGAIRVAARELPAWLEYQLHAQAAGSVPAWQQPQTFSREELWLYERSSGNDNASAVLLVSQRHDQRAALADAIESLGHRVVNDASTQPAVIVGNVCGDLEAALKEFEPLFNRWPAAGWVLLVDFPRPQDVALAERRGCGIILPKPFSLIRLEQALTQNLKK